MVTVILRDAFLMVTSTALGFGNVSADVLSVRAARKL
jgi:hypothetical protein